ncbi:MAG: hypothetical protein ACMUHM_03475 [Thermoplasmatota archaeon]
MKDQITKTAKKLDIPPVLGAIKERMVEHRFNIDDYDVKKGTIEGRRNNLDKVIIGLNRKLQVFVKKDNDEISVELHWGFLPRNCTVTGFEFFIIAMAILRNFQLNGFLIALLIGGVGAILNLGLFFLLRYRMTSVMRRDLDDLEIALEEGKRKGKMTIF